MVYGECSLCKNMADLQKSHIIPSFVGRWLKNSSATGFMRGVQDYDKRLQDLPKIPLLCKQCEQIFSKYEDYFARNFFYPFFNEGISEFEYDERLLGFLISISWRTLKIGYEPQLKLSPWAREGVDIAEENWRKYLLGEKKGLEGYEHHLLFFDFVEKETGMPAGFQWYSLRGTDSTLASNEQDIFSFTHFPWIFIVSTIQPKTFQGWKNTLILKKGKHNTNFQIKDTLFVNFLIDRSKLVIDYIEKFLDTRVLAKIISNPDRFFKSQTYPVILAEIKRLRKRRKNNLPIHIIKLIEIIEDSETINEKYDIKDNPIILYLNYIADELSKLDISDLLHLNQEIESLLNRTDIMKPDDSIIYYTNNLIIKFMINYCDGKDSQFKLLDSSLSDIVIKRDKEDTRKIIVFSFNPLEPEIPFETGYYFEDVKKFFLDP